VGSLSGAREEGEDTSQGEKSGILTSSTVLVIRTATCLSLVRWKTFFLLLSTVLSFLILWVATSDLFDVPRDVRRDRQLYSIARKQYLDNPHYWYSQYLQLEHSLKRAVQENREQDIPNFLQQITPQALIAFLVNHTSIKIEKLKCFAIIPKISGSSFVITASKPETNIWPFKVMVSIEFQVHFSADAVSILVSRLRRGSQELSPALSWAYFGPELEYLKNVPYASIRTRQEFAPPRPKIYGKRLTMIGQEIIMPSRTTHNGEKLR
jgi:hypothetical protein